jgi:hypothetical protein
MLAAKAVGGELGGNGDIQGFAKSTIGAMQELLEAREWCGNRDIQGFATYGPGWHRFERGRKE